MFIKPAPGARVRHPVSQRVLPPEGENVSDHDEFYQRRLADGDVERATPEPASDVAERRASPRAKA